MAKIDRVVKVDISLNTAGLSKEGFSTILVAGYHDIAGGIVQSFTQASDLTDAGFESTDPIYVACAAAFSQTPSPSVVKVGQLIASEQVISFKDNALPPVGTSLALTVAVTSADGTSLYAKTINKTIALTDTVNAIYQDYLAALTTANLVLAIDSPTAATNLDIKLADTSHLLHVSYIATDTAGTNLGLAKVTAATGASADMTAALASFLANDSEFYGVILASRVVAEIKDMAAACQANKKLFGTGTAEADVFKGDATDDIGSFLQGKSYDHVYTFGDKEAGTEYAECALMARCFAINPGGETWANKQLTGVTSDKLSETEFLACKKKNVNTYEKFRNLAITQIGKVASGEWIDVIRFRDWLEEEIKTNVFTALINSDKVPYTDPGIAIIEKAIHAALVLGQTRGGIAPTEYDSDGNVNEGFKITVPLAIDCSSNNKANRLLEDISFTARLAGAIHNVVIKGSFTYGDLIESKAV